MCGGRQQGVRGVSASVHNLTRARTLSAYAHLFTTACLQACMYMNVTHAYLIGVSHIGASLQHVSQTGHESEACTNKQEPVLVLFRDVDLLKVLRKHVLDLLVGQLRRRFAGLKVDGRQHVRQHVRWVCSSMSSHVLSRVHPDCICTLVHKHMHVCVHARACVYLHIVCAYIHIHMYAHMHVCVCTHIRTFIYTNYIYTACLRACLHAWTRPYLVFKCNIRAVRQEQGHCAR